MCNLGFKNNVLCTCLTRNSKVSRYACVKFYFHLTCVVFSVVKVFVLSCVVKVRVPVFSANICPNGGSCSCIVYTIILRQFTKVSEVVQTVKDSVRNLSALNLASVMYIECHIVLLGTGFTTSRMILARHCENFALPSTGY